MPILAFFSSVEEEVESRKEEGGRCVVVLGIEEQRERLREDEICIVPLLCLIEIKCLLFSSLVTAVASGGWKGGNWDFFGYAPSLGRMR